jgi:hypothetical protein
MSLDHYEVKLDFFTFDPDTLLELEPDALRKPSKVSERASEMVVFGWS